MKKALKITGITLASLVGLVLVVAGIAVAMITSSGRLTKMVKKYAPQFVNCEMQLGKADLTLFKTFPNVGIEIDNVALINPMAGSPSDTLANIDNLIVVVDAKKLRKENAIVVRRCILEDAFVNLYTDEEGQNNFDVFNTSKDDTTSTTFDYLVDIEEVKLVNSNLLYTDARTQLKGSAKGLDLDLKGKMQDKDINADLVLLADDLSLKLKNMDLSLQSVNLDFDGDIGQYDQIDGTLKLRTPNANLSLGEPYLENDNLNLTLPVSFSIEQLAGHLNQAQIGLNDYLILLDGDAAVAKNGDVTLDFDLNTNTLIVEDVLTYLPQDLQQTLSNVKYAGKLNIKEAKVQGSVTDSLLPLITAKITSDDLTVDVPDLPYPFKVAELDGLLSLDLNQKDGQVEVNSLNAKFNRSDLKISGLVDDLLGDIGLKLKVNGDVPMTDVKGFLPKNLKLNGRTNLDMTTNFTVEQLLKSLKDYNLNRLSAKANLKVRDFAFDMDTLHASSPLLNIGLTLPASAKEKGRKGAFVSLASSTLNAKAGKDIVADLQQPDIKLSADSFKGGMEKMLLDAAINCSRLDLVYDTINAHINTPAITFVTTPDKNAKRLKARVTLNGKDINAKMGESYALNSNMLKVDASVDENKNKTDFLNHWNPAADFVLSNAMMQVAGLGEDIKISNIDFLFNSNELDFKKSTFRIGQSDMSLQGSVIGIKEWIEDHKNLMKGEMQLTSNYVDINEILDLTSGLGRSEETSKGEGQEDDPFMVPEGIDFSFILNTKKALYDNFDLNNLNGTMTVKDGTLILREIGFTNKAAEMQLTAMYQSPRKNNLFLAMDFHLLRVQINDLLTMIPYIDTLVPMLKTFDGQAEFHIGAETNLKSNYEPKISTLRAAADIEGKNLTVNDKFTFTKITDMLDVSTNGLYRVDSLDVQLTAFKDEIDLWPSQIAIGKYKVTVDGRMTLDKNGEYHLSVTQSPLPVRMGLKISGPFNKLEYKLEDCKYPNLYKPNKRSDTEQMYFELKKKIADRLKENVR
jgi:hypothetical protein